VPCGAIQEEGGNAGDRLDGGWTRGFDYEKWESHGSNADDSWTAWCLETGWTNAVIDLALSMYLDGDCFIEKRPAL
jgi:hypothetical protein